ncbi:hypothetical protein Vretimale_14069 [Volvox reticuliferus]|nr:hypothetical protein Vretimale_14069 [Volvox reticuliferus]
MHNQHGSSLPCRPAKDKVVLDIRRGCEGTQLTVRVVRGRFPTLMLVACLTALTAMAWVPGGPRTPGEESASVFIESHTSSGGDDAGERAAPGWGTWRALSRESARGRARDATTSKSTTARGRVVAMGLLMLASASGAIWGLFQVTSESVLVLAGGVGYILESVRRCGLRQRRFLDARDVSYVTLSEVRPSPAVTSATSSRSYPALGTPPSQPRVSTTTSYRAIGAPTAISQCRTRTYCPGCG